MSSYLTSRPVLQERHRQFFEALTPEEVLRVLARMQQDRLIRSVQVSSPSGEWLFEFCRGEGLDHAAVVFPMCRDTDTIGRSAVEKLVGKPIVRWVPPPPRPVDWRPDPNRPPPGTFRLDQIVLTVAPNPKAAGSATWHRYRNWRAGETVAQCMARGLTRADVNWDIDPSRKFVRLGNQEEWDEISRPLPKSEEAE